MRESYHTVIVGAGPGGLAAAELLAAAGIEVLVIEKNDLVGPKVCAGFLPFDEDTEKRYGTPDKIFSSIDIQVVGRKFELAARSPFLAVYDRAKLGAQMLASATRAGAEVITGTSAKQINRTHIKCDGRAIGYSFLIGADGANSVVRRKLGIPLTRTGTTFQYVVPTRSERFELCLDYKTFGLGCGWVVPHANHTLVGLGRDMDPKKIWPIGEHCQKWAESRGWQVAGQPTESWPIAYDYRGWRFGNVFLVGDAGGFASGLTGEGIANAIISGRETAKMILNPKHRPTGLWRMLRRKEQHERLMKLIRISPALANKAVQTTLLTCRSKTAAERLARFLF